MRRRKLFKVVAGYAVIFSFLAAVTYFTGNPFGMIFFVATFIALRYCYNDSVTFHFESAITCVAVTCGMFVVVGIILMPFRSISILAPVMVGLSVTWLVYWLGKMALYRDENKFLKLNSIDCETEIEELKEKIEELTKIVALSEMDENELQEHCKYKGLNDVEQGVAYLEFFKKIPIIEIGFKARYSRAHLYRIRKRMYEKLELVFNDKKYKNDKKEQNDSKRNTDDEKLLAA